MTIWNICEKTGALSCSVSELGNAYLFVRSGETIIDTRKLSWENSRAVNKGYDLEFKVNSLP